MLYFRNKQLCITVLRKFIAPFQGRAYLTVPPVFRGKFYKIPQKYFMNSAADLSKFCSNSAEIILSFYINYK